MMATPRRSELARVRGLGPAGEGVQHWWAQRLTAVALVPLSAWFVVSLIGLLGADRAAAVAWLGSPLPLGLMILTVVATFHHAQLGLQVVIEDYVARRWLRVALIVAARFAAAALGLAAVLALLFIAFRG